MTGWHSHLQHPVPEGLLSSLQDFLFFSITGNCLWWKVHLSMLKMAVSTSLVAMGIFLIIYSSIDPINITLPFSLIMCCNSPVQPNLVSNLVTLPPRSTRSGRRIGRSIWGRWTSPTRQLASSSPACPLSVTAHNEGERQSYIDVINITIYYQKYSHNHMTGWHSYLQHWGYGLYQGYLRGPYEYLEHTHNLHQTCLCPQVPGIPKPLLHQKGVTAHNEEERQSYIDGINTTLDGL